MAAIYDLSDPTLEQGQWQYQATKAVTCCDIEYDTSYGHNLDLGIDRSQCEVISHSNQVGSFDVSCPEDMVLIAIRVTFLLYVAEYTTFLAPLNHTVHIRNHLKYFHEFCASVIFQDFFVQINEIQKCYCFFLAQVIAFHWFYMSFAQMIDLHWFYILFFAPMIGPY